MAELMSQRAYARHRGVTLQAVQKALKRGRIALEQDANGRSGIDPVAADAAWAANTLPRRELPVPEPAPAAAQPAATEPEESATTGTGQSIMTSRAVREAYQARMARLDYEERAGRLVPAGAVAAEAYTRARMLRDRIMAVPARISAKLAAIDDERLVAATLDEALRAALQEEAEHG